MYTTATIRSNEPLADGSTRLMVEFSGDAAEELKQRAFTVTGSTTALQLRQWVTTQLADLNGTRTIAKLAALQEGQVIPPAALPGAVAATASDIWVEKARRLQRATALGLTAAQAVTDIAALKADVNATYDSAYLVKV